MSSIKLKDRIDSYIDSSNYKLLSKLPVITIVNGKSFHKITGLLDKPFSKQFSDIMLSTALKLCIEIEGVIFAYQFSDEIVLISRNDQSIETNPWYDNRIQKICSATASIATQHFNKTIYSSDINLSGDALFISQVFVVPNIAEATNTFIYKQQQNFLTSIQLACYYELLKKYDKNTIREMLSDLSIDGKIDLLKQEADVDFNDYPMAFRRGNAIYKSPKVIDGVIKNKWVVNDELPIFTKDTSFLSQLFKMGSDLYR
jgi:tRNA(His) 5'-end guanylyltransferase